ncbi:MAG: hypothetical protein H6Q73_1134 [Firmicutes bacterium]|nr:hypothetical protein [Bacillota bacterium]
MASKKSNDSLEQKKAKRENQEINNKFGRRTEDPNHPST